ncbi:MAG: nicotinate-nucleotide adenylyltransferase [Clostridia bacterium]|nr:nicotinate-nucleotide adenylyltransferase [Clostridia bacterium]
MKIGILGGTLNPIHNGHIEIALAAMGELGLDRVMLLPSGDPPYKRVRTDKRDRLAMAELAARPYENMFVNDLEVRREGATYTVETLTALSVEYPDVRWTYIVGGDTLNKLDSWREFPRIARLCDFATACRPGTDKALTALRAHAISACYGAKVDVLSVSGPEVSSTAIRHRVAEGRDISTLVPAAIDAYIRDHGLYLCDYTEAQIVERLRGMLTGHRFEHTLGVADTAMRLAPRCGVDPHRARLAGLLHDCAKPMPLDEMVAMVTANLTDLDQAELETRAVLHAPAGMIVARDMFGVRDPQILSAIRKHTLGDGEMSAMDALIYVADFIEPGREVFPGMVKARRLAESDIWQAAVYCAELSSKHLKSRGQKAHPRTQRMMDVIRQKHPDDMKKKG